MQKRNEHIRKLELIIEKIIEQPELHAKWLNTLSFLEHSGSRKIHKANLGKYINESILSHASEEARHAYFFKRMMKKVLPEKSQEMNYRYSNLLLGFQAYRYFHGLDLQVYRYFKQSYKREDLRFICYAYVTYLIEERASLVFGIYEERLKKKLPDISIMSVIKEEEKHLKEIYELLISFDPNHSENLAYLSEVEANLFEQFLTRLEKKVLLSSEDSVLVQ
ncbi:MAG: hypothetical protein NZ853_04805 [Leptospiraceae bacterium]|nr:hypothetical protein [Leptospiraceae bacterium]MDW7975908.1 hypothetical protein [Leptospiraceae bacterium]